MAQRPWIVPALFVLAACAPTSPAPTPTATTPDPLSEGIPDDLRMVFSVPYQDEAYDDPDLPGARLLVERFTVVSPGGTSIGEGELTAVDYRVPDSNVACGGEAYPGSDAHDLADPPGGMTATLVDDTTMSFVPDRQVVTYEADGGFPVCFEQFGTYVATFPPGAKPGTQEGSYHLIGGSLELD